MFEFIYTGFFLVLLGQGLFFLFLTLPTPRGWKGKVVGFLNTSSSVKTIKKIHLGFCIIVLVFFLQSYTSQQKYHLEKSQAKKGDSIASELKYLYYSYMGLKTQRNTYIALMLLFVSVALNGYVWVLNYMYSKREQYENSGLPAGQNKDPYQVEDRAKAKSD